MGLSFLGPSGFLVPRGASARRIPRRSAGIPKRAGAREPAGEHRVLWFPDSGWDPQSGYHPCAAGVNSGRKPVSGWKLGSRQIGETFGELPTRKMQTRKWAGRGNWERRPLVTGRSWPFYFNSRILFCNLKLQPVAYPNTI